MMADPQLVIHINAATVGVTITAVVAISSFHAWLVGLIVSARINTMLLDVGNHYVSKDDLKSHIDTLHI